MAASSADARLTSATRFKTLEQFILDQQGQIPFSAGSFSRLLHDLSIAAKVVNRDIRRAGLIDVTGASGEVNVQGEVQQKLDAIAHTEFVEALKAGGEVGLIVSEEAAEAIPLETRGGGRGKYIVLFDPLDGSSNIDVGVTVGTIFSIYRLPEGAEEATLEMAEQPGTEQVAAGYVIYGSTTMLVYTTGDGVNGFTLDPPLGEFLLSHPNIRIPDGGSYYSINEGEEDAFGEGLIRYLDWLKSQGREEGRSFSARYIGSLVSDFHRNLLKGGVYLYPATGEHPEGKLRLMYEANPVAFIAEQAGGKASDGRRRILEVAPEDVHQRTPLVIGSADLVERYEAFVAESR